MTSDNQHLVWRTSSFSGNSGNCVEVAGLLDGSRLVRDTKSRERGYFTAARPQWSEFMSAIKAGRYDG